MVGVQKGLVKKSWPKGPCQKRMSKKGSLRANISQDKSFKILEWILFIGFIIVAGWFASGVPEQFFSRKTSFSENEEKYYVYPVVVIVFIGRQASEVNLTNAVITYRAGAIENMQTLKIGENYFHTDGYKTEKVIFQSLENKDGNRAFRVIHSTPMINDGYSPKIKIYTKLEKKNDSDSDLVEFFLTSLDSSPGFYDYYWKDGKQFQIQISKNTEIKYKIQTQITNYLENTGKCQRESFYNCIAFQVDSIEFDICANKCIPEIFSNMEENYRTPLCQNDSHIQQCVLKHIHNREVGSNCKKSCSVIEYFGQLYLYIPIKSDEDDWDLYFFKYRTNDDNHASTKDEYLIYDAIGMVGSVGGTLGMFIEF